DPAEGGRPRLPPARAAQHVPDAAPQREPPAARERRPRPARAPRRSAGASAARGGRGRRAVRGDRGAAGRFPRRPRRRRCRRAVVQGGRRCPPYPDRHGDEPRVPRASGGRAPRRRLRTIGAVGQPALAVPVRTFWPDEAWLPSAFSSVTVMVEYSFGETPAQSVTLWPSLNVPIGTSTPAGLRSQPSSHTPPPPPRR